MCFYLKTPYWLDIVDSFTLDSWPTMWELMPEQCLPDTCIFSVRLTPTFLPLRAGESSLVVHMAPFKTENHKQEAQKHSTQQTTWRTLDLMSEKGNEEAVSPWSCLADIVCNRRPFFFCHSILVWKWQQKCQVYWQGHYQSALVVGVLVGMGSVNKENNCAWKEYP